MTKRSYILILAVSILISLTILIVVGWKSHTHILERLSWGSILIFVILILVSWGFNALRLLILLGVMGKRTGFFDATLIIISSEFAGSATPGGIGMPVALTFFLRRMGIGLSQSASMVAVIILMDLIFYGTALPLSAFGSVLSAPSWSTLRLAAVGFCVIGACFVALWLIVTYYRQICSETGRWMARSSRLSKYRFRLARKTIEFVRTLREFQAMKRKEQIGLVATTFGFWLPRFFVLAVAVWIAGKSVPLAYVFLVQCVLNVAGQMIALPSGGGSVEAGYLALMSSYLSKEQIAFTLIVWRIFNFYWYLVVGGFVFIYKAGGAAFEMLSGKKPFRQ